MNTPTQAVIHLFGVPDSVSEVAGGLCLQFAGLAIHTAALGPLKALFAGCAFKLDATLTNGAWVAHSAFAISAPEATRSSSAQSTVLSSQTTVAAKQPTNDSAPIDRPAKASAPAAPVVAISSFAALTRPRAAGAARPVQSVEARTTSPAPVREQPAASQTTGQATVTSMFSRASGPVAPPTPQQHKAPAETSAERPRFSLNTDDDVDFDIPF